jgi:rsbT co-antagonist protein RsbR
MCSRIPLSAEEAHHVPGTHRSSISELLRQHESEILAEWLRAQTADGRRSHLLDEKELRQQSAEFLRLVRTAAEGGRLDDITSREWDETRRMLEDMSRSRARLGFTPSQTAMFVFSLKEPIFERIRREHGQDPAALAEATGTATRLLDAFGLYTTEVYQKGREELITRQQQEMMELSTPVVELWDGVLALPLIGTLDSARTQVVMESLLQRIVDTGSGIAIIDITGVPTVDTLVAQHLLKTVAAARLMGADCIISGIRPQIAQTIVHLGVDLQDVVTKATLADAFAIALRRLGLGVQRVSAGAPSGAADTRAADSGSKA